MSTNKNLSKLERLPLRDAWKHEAKDFTPWLAGEGLAMTKILCQIRDMLPWLRAGDVHLKAEELING